MARLPVDLAEKFSLFSEHWSPKVVARLNDYEIKVVKVQGEFVWHTHEDTDELFLVTSGELTIRMHMQTWFSDPVNCSSFLAVSSIVPSPTGRCMRSSWSRSE